MSAVGATEAAVSEPPKRASPAQRFKLEPTRRKPEPASLRCCRALRTMRGVSKRSARTGDVQGRRPSCRDRALGFRARLHDTTRTENARHSDGLAGVVSASWTLSCGHGPQRMRLHHTSKAQLQRWRTECCRALRMGGVSNIGARLHEQLHDRQVPLLRRDVPEPQTQPPP